MNTIQATRTRPRTVWTAIIAVTVLLAGFMVWNSFRSAQSMSAAAAPDEKDFARAPQGATVKLVLQITESTPDGLIQGKILNKKTDKIYIRTDTSVTIHSTPATKLVMGSQADIKPVAVVHVTGIVKSDRSVDAAQIVILTGYVEVQ
jgi:uncharacterized protein YdeI (BOF family)